MHTAGHEPGPHTLAEVRGAHVSLFVVRDGGQRPPPYATLAAVIDAIIAQDTPRDFRHCGCPAR